MILVVVFLSEFLEADNKGNLFHAGAYAIDITPTTLPVSVPGSFGPVMATHVHDLLHARCLVLDNGDTRVAFAICDSCMIPREIFDAAKQQASRETGIAVDHILASATHTHTAVTVTPLFQSTVEFEYCEFLADRIADGIIRAASQLEPARIGWAVGNNPRQVFNRRWFMRPGFSMTDPFGRSTDRVRMNPPRASPKLFKPAGLIDPEVTVLSVQAADGRPIAVLANYSLHYVGGVPSGTLSADYFGEFARQFTLLIGAAGTDPPFVGIMTNGTSGDINNINFLENSPGRQPFDQIRLVAEDVAQSAHAAYRRIEYRDWVPLKIIEKEIELGVRRPNPEEIDRAQMILKEAGDGPWRGDRRVIYAAETLDLAEYPASVLAKLQALRIGGLGIVTTPCETFVETGLAIKQQSLLRPTFTIELANGYNGYLPTPEQHALGGYETWRAKSSYLAVDTEPKIRSTLLKMLNEIAE